MRTSSQCCFCLYLLFNVLLGYGHHHRGAKDEISERFRARQLVEVRWLQALLFNGDLLPAERVVIMSSTAQFRVSGFAITFTLIVLAA